MAKREREQKKGYKSIVDTMVKQMTRQVATVFAIVMGVSVALFWNQATQNKQTKTVYLGCRSRTENARFGGQR